MFVILSCFLLVQQAGSSTWTFGGYDDPAYKVLDQKTGRIKPFEYEKIVVFDVALIYGISGACRGIELANITLEDIPNCTEIKYVQVEVKNQLNDPYVSFKSSENSVPISYKPMQATMSHFDLIAKGIHKEGCSSNKSDSSPGHKFEDKWIIPGRGPKKPWVNGVKSRTSWG